MAKTNFGRGNKDGSNPVYDLTTAQASADVHQHDDSDSGPRAHHHTLGTGVNQAAPGLAFKALQESFAAYVEEVNPALASLDSRITILEDFDLDTRVSALEAEPAPETEPVGVVKMWATSASPAPAKYLLCDGTQYLISAFPDLFAIIGIIFGGDATHFNVPNFRGRFPYGATRAGGGTPGALAGYSDFADANGGTTIPTDAGAGRLDHRHTHTNDDAVHNQQTNTSTGGTAQRLTNPTSHTHTMSSRGVNGANTAYHGFMTVEFIIRALP